MTVAALVGAALATLILAGGGSPEPGASVRTTVPSTGPPPAPSVAPDPTAATLAGRFRATATLVQSSGLRGVAKTATYGFAFAPVCIGGPCAVTLTIAGSPPLSVFLARQGAAYSGTGEGWLGIRCGSRQVPVSVSVDLRILEATVVKGMDRASRVEATLRLWAHPQGCGVGRAVESVVAELAS